MGSPPGETKVELPTITCWFFDEQTGIITKVQAYAIPSSSVTGNRKLYLVGGQVYQAEAVTYHGTLFLTLERLVNRAQEWQDTKRRELRKLSEFLDDFGSGRK